MQNDETFATRANNYMAPDTEYHGETQVMHFLELLRDVVGFDTIREKVVTPLTGRKIAPYYGCLLLRPSKTMQMDDPENPSVIEDFIRAIGAEPVVTSMRNECCGGYIALEDKASAQKKSTRIVNVSKDAGAEAIVTACPLCRYNLEKNGGSDIPVVYFTELLAEALGVKEESDGE